MAMMRRAIALAACAGVMVAGGGAALAQTPTPEPDPCALSSEAAFFIGLADARFYQRDFGAADTFYGCALTLDPTSDETFSQRGYARSVLGDDAGALEDFAAALAIDGQRVDVFINRGALYMRQGNFALALADLSQALTIDPDNVRALHNRAVVQAAEGTFARALTDIDAAIALAPEDPALHAVKGAIYLALANASYSEFRALAGDTTPFFGGAPVNLYLGFERATVTGNYGEWLALLRPGRER